MILIVIITETAVYMTDRIKGYLVALCSLDGGSSDQAVSLENMTISNFTCGGEIVILLI